MKGTMGRTRFGTSIRLPVVLLCSTLMVAFALAGGVPVGLNALGTPVAHAQDACLDFTKTIDGPFRTSDNLKLGDTIIPVGVMFLLNGGRENLFYFQVDLKVENCGSTDLTGVTVSDNFGKEVQPFETTDPANVDLTWEIFNAGNVFTREYIVWTVGTIPAGDYRTLSIKVGTEFNGNMKLEPAQAGKTLLYNGRDGNGQWLKSASVTTDQGLSASVERMSISFGAQVGCAGTNGQWDQLRMTKNNRVVPHDKCAAVTTTLPIVLTASAP